MREDLYLRRGRKRHRQQNFQTEGGIKRNKNVNFSPPPTLLAHSLHCCVFVSSLFFQFSPKLKSKWIIANLFLWRSCAISVSAWQSICQEPYLPPLHRRIVARLRSSSFSHHTLLENHEFDLSSLLLVLLLLLGKNLVVGLALNWHLLGSFSILFPSGVSSGKSISDKAMSMAIYFAHNKFRFFLFRFCGE